MRRVMLVLLATALGGCGGTAKLAKPPSELELLNRSAQQAFSRGRYAQSATLYEASLDRALIEDRPQAIVDARFNLALSQTYLGRYQLALNEATLAEAERTRRGLGPDPALQLLRATIHYRLGEWVLAQRVLDPLLADTTVGEPTSAKAHFLAGMLAADRNDASMLRRHRDALPGTESREAHADRLELDARLVSLEGYADEALRILDRAVLLRSLDEDYRGMARALVSAGTIAERAGHSQAASGYWLRAGRSGSRRGEPDARQWLERARALAKHTGDAVMVREAEAMLADIGTAEEPR